MEDNLLRDLGMSARAAEAAHRRRNELIVAARVDGYTWPRIAEAVGLSVTGTMKAARAVNGGRLPDPRQRG